MLPRLTFIHDGNDLFLSELIAGLRDDYDIVSVKPSLGVILTNELENADVVWFEWCNQLVAEVSQWPQLSKYVCRLHSYEMFTRLPSAIKWNNIDKLIFVSQFVRDRCVEKFNIPEDKTTLIHNGVDLDKFTIAENKVHGKRIAIVGYMNSKKGPMLLMQTLAAIHEYDPEFTFHYIGAMQDERVALYMAHYLATAPFDIEMTEWTKDMPGYFSDKDYIISTSMFEACPCSIIEAMASGLVPIVHNWPGASDLFPESLIFTSPAEAVDIIDNNAHIDSGHTMRNLVVDRFSLNTQIDEVKTLLSEVLSDTAND